MLLLVFSQAGLLNEASTAVAAAIRAFSGVRTVMFYEIRLLDEAFFAHITDIRAFPRMNT